MKNCNTCEFWYNLQRELGYSKDRGICACDFDNNPNAINFFIHNAHEKLEHDILNEDGTTKNWRSEFCTHQNFGCNYWRKRDE